MAPQTSPAEITAAVLDEATRQHVNFNADGLVAAIVQDYNTARVLMMAWMDEHALAYTLRTRKGTYWSRSRQQYWVKGETSGCVQRVRTVEVDCDGDALVLQIDQTGGACHTGANSCFDTLMVLSDDD